ncbi:CRISPR system precrRNA processing endoribonuclease RAMP protein Cas6 [Sulfolobus tengchongensis]|uniref:CRISPR system precrRNA processing endoribonuclease RAMP protein Cas6 n=1 Tax=Sulfolobus tengchongensis TaxID=207809 RepID=A0AAX4L360_9CREN
MGQNLSMHIFKVNYSLIPLHDVILPVPSSKVLKNLILSGKFLPSLAKLVESEIKSKPLFISALGNGEFRYLSDDDKIMNVKANSRLNGFVSFPYIDEVYNEISEGVYETPYGKFSLIVNSVEILDIQRMRIEDYMNYNIYVKFVTPVILSSKILLPPSLKDRYKNIKPGFSLLPSVGLIIAYAYRSYYSILGRTDEQEWATRAFKLSVLSNALAKIVGFNLSPKTVIIGRDEKNNLRKSRGVVGWIEFNIAERKIKKMAIKCFTISSYLGLGKSRGIGLGEIRVTLKKTK